MIQTFYVQLNAGGYITDIIEYEHEGYIQKDLYIPLPIQILGGWWKLDENNGFIFDYEKYVELNQPE